MELKTGSASDQLNTESDLEQLVRRYQEPLLRYCAGILRNREDAKDAVQTAFIKAWRKRSSLKAKDSLKSWLYRIAYRTSVDLLRTRKTFEEIPGDLGAGSTDARKTEFSEETLAALGSLSALDRAIVEERILEEMSYEEMSKIHLMPVATLRRRYSRARRKLQALLTKEEKPC